MTTRLDHLERVRVKLRIISPTHIGSGEKLLKKEQIYDPQTRQLLVPSMPRLLEYMMTRCPRGTLEAYEDFLKKQTTDDLGEFLRSHSIRFDPSLDWVERRIAATGNPKRINELNTFIHHVDGSAYIPGSSIKGAIRMALIAYCMSAQQRNQLKSAPNYKDAEKVLRLLKADDRNPSDAVNDIMRGLEVSDSTPFDSDDMVVCQREDIGLTEDTLACGRISSFRECLRPGSETYFYMTLDRTILPKNFITVMQKALNYWDELNYAMYDSKFEENGIELADTACREGLPIRLGGGTGFQTHSLVYSIFRDDSESALRQADHILMNGFRNTYIHPGKEAAPYRKKVSEYGNKIWPLGCCELIL